MAFGASFVLLESVDSTNNYTANLIKQTDVAEGTVVMAQFQTAGRGQRGNSWYSSRGESLLMSVVLRPKHLRATAQFELNQLICVAIYRYLSEQLGVNAQVKWPNDILVDGEKLAGILIENSLRGQWIEYTIAGVGLNLNQVDFSSDFAATSLQKSTGKQHDPLEVGRGLLKFIEEEYHLLGNPESLTSRYMQVLYGVNENLRYREGEEEFEARITGLGPHGELRLKKTSGQEVLYQFKQVTLLGKSGG